MNWNKLDPRIIYLIMFLAILLPMFRPLGLPIVVTDQTKQAYAAFDALKKGDVVWISYDAGTGSHPELAPQVVAVTKHLYSKGVRFVLFTIWDTMSPQLIDGAVRPVMNQLGAKYGVDWVNLGYKPGTDTTLRVAADDVWKACGGVDYDGTALDKIPLMADVKELKKVAMIYSVQVGSPGTGDYITYLGTPYKTKIISGSATTMAANMVNNLKAGQIVGLLAGLPGAAEYEQLINSPGRGAAGMDGQSFSHLAVIAFIILGNLGYYMTMKKGGR